MKEGPLRRLAVVTDELSDDPAEAVQLASKAGIPAIEIRGVHGRRVPDISTAEIREVVAVLRDLGVAIVGISPGLGKGELPVNPREAILPVLECANALSAESVTFFGFPDTTPIRAASDVLSLWRSCCEDAGLQACLENSAGHHAAGRGSLFELARATGMRVVWDPANARAAGDTETICPDASDIPRIARVHVKGFLPGRGCVDPNQGVIDWKEHIRDLGNAGYMGMYTIEPHQWTDRLRAFQHARNCLAAWLELHDVN